MHKYYNYLQSMFDQKLFTKDIKDPKHRCLGLVNQESRNKREERKGLKVS
jgi:hypothetical protein